MTAAMTSKPNKQFLTLKKKVEVIRTEGKNRGMGVQELGEIFNLKIKSPYIAAGTYRR